MSVLTVENVSKIFETRGGQVEAIRRFDLTVSEKEFVTIVGPSGCGKSTLLNMLVGLLSPTTGELRFRGQLVTGPIPQIGYITQRDTLLPWRTLQDNVEFALEVRGVDKLTRAKRALELIEMVGLKGFEKHYPHELSGGMRQRTMIIRSLAYDPEVLLLDEPFGALDAQTRGILQNQLMEIQALTGKTLIFITHDLVEAVALADRVVVISRQPGVVSAIYDIPMPRPRNVFEVHDDPVFNGIYAKVKSHLMREMAAK